MARLPRVIAINTPHHITQRVNARRFILEADTDRAVYLQLLRQNAELQRLSVLGYCLMSNHVHLIAAPSRPESIAATLKAVHGRYAAYFNARYLSSGHVWQGRFYSCPLDSSHLWAALRYTELNPVRAGLVARAEDYAWSSAAVHCGAEANPGLLDLAPWRQRWTAAQWRDHLAASEFEEEDDLIRRHTHTGRPLGRKGFITALEKSLHRRLAPAKGGRPPKRKNDARQEDLF